MSETTPPAGMRFRDHRDVVWTGEHFVFYGLGYKTAASLIHALPNQFTDADHAPLMALKAEPLEPNPVDRDQPLWSTVHALLEQTWDASQKRGYDWLGLDATADAIVRAVQAERAGIARVLPKIYNVYDLSDGSVQLNAHSDAETAIQHVMLDCTHVAVRLAVLAEGAEAVSALTDAIHHWDRVTLRELAGYCEKAMSREFCTTCEATWHARVEVLNKLLALLAPAETRGVET